MAPNIIFQKFGGMIPALDERLLPPDNAVYSENAFLQAGRLEPLAADIEIHVLDNPAARYAFRIPINNPGIDNLVNSYWLEFLNPETFVVRSPVVNQTDGGRYYWANGTLPPGYTTKDRVEADEPRLVLGIPRPDVPPVVAATGGAAPTETRAYAYTWVSESFEEGQPSLPTVETGNADGTWTITVTPPAPVDLANRTLEKWRLYRTVTGPAGEVGFFFVTEQLLSVTEFVDDVLGDVVAQSNEMTSVDYSPPPDDLMGMVSMPNGMIAGWRENEIWFCEPYMPHAWPSKYVLGVESPIVGLGTIDQNLMVLTSGQPYVATGVHPLVMTLKKVQPLEPCTAPKSVVSTPNGVLYTSYNGLILIGPGGGTNVTYDTIRKDEWLRLLNLQTIHASYFMNGYYTFSGISEGVFQTDAFQVDTFQQRDFTGTQVGAHIAGDQHLGYMTLTASSPTYNVMTDLWTGETFVLRNERVFHVDRREYLPRQSYKWKSKIVQMPYKDNYGAAKIFFDKPLGGGPIEPTYFKVYADGILKMVKPVTKSGEQFRLPSGYKADFYQFELEGQLMIYNVQIAPSPRELRRV